MARLHVLVIGLAGVACAGPAPDASAESGDDTARDPAPDEETGADSAEDTDDSSCSDETDADGDGYRVADGDCADDDAARHPGAEDVCDAIDQDCDGAPQGPGSCSRWVPLDARALTAWVGEAAGAGLTPYLGIPDADHDGREEIVAPFRCEDVGGERCVAGVAVLAGLPDALDTPWSTAAVGAWRYEPGVDKPWGGVQTAGDFDGDGWDDLWIPSIGEDAAVGGASYLVRGPPEAWPTYAPALSDASDAWWTPAEPFDQYGWDFDGGGDLDGDGLADAAALAWGDGSEGEVDGSVAILLGRTGDLPRGRSVAEEILLSKATDGSELSVDGVRIGGDLDGDGARELVVPYDGGLALVSGSELRAIAGAPLADVVTVYRPGGALGVGYIAVLPARGTAPGDLDGDGVDELFYTSAAEDASSPDGTRSCLTFASFGSPPLEGQLDDVVRVEVCQAAQTNYGGVHASHDLDGDGVLDPGWAWQGSPFGDAGPSTAACFVATGALPVAGRVDEVEQRWCMDHGDTISTADLDGDGLPEMLGIDPEAYEGAEHAGRVWVLGGFSIPWADAAAW